MTVTKKIFITGQIKENLYQNLMTLADAGLVRSIANALHTHVSDAKFALMACEALHVLSYVQSQNRKDLFLREGACDALQSFRHRNAQALRTDSYKRLRSTQRVHGLLLGHFHQNAGAGSFSASSACST